MAVEKKKEHHVAVYTFEVSCLMGGGYVVNIVWYKRRKRRRGCNAELVVPGVLRVRSPKTWGEAPGAS